MYLGIIKDGENENPIDKTSIIGTILLFIIPISLYYSKKKITDETILSYLNYSIKPLIQILYIVIIFIVCKIKYSRLCNNNSTSVAIKYSLLIAPLTLFCGKLLSIFIKYLNCKFNLNIFYKIFSNDFIKKILDDSNENDNNIIEFYSTSSISFIIIYIMLNMYHSKNNNLQLTCNNNISKNIIIISLILNIIIPIIINQNKIEPL